jgi:hypothetical protein
MDYTSNCLALEVSLGNGAYGAGSLKIGGEFKISNHQKFGIRIGGGLDVSPKFGYGISISPYTWENIDIMLSIDHTRTFGGEYIYRIDDLPNDIYTFDNTNLITPAISVRLIGSPLIAFHITTGWALGLNNSNIKLTSGTDVSSNRKHINNSLIGGIRFEFGGVFRIRKWNKDSTK